jgi:hypothetical protein
VRGLRLALLSILCIGPALAASQPSLQCDVGPISKGYGGSQWLVYSCNDARSVVFVSAPGSPASPFVFLATVGAKDFKLHGEGTGNKQASDAAYKELSVLTLRDLAALTAQARGVARNVP